VTSTIRVRSPKLKFRIALQAICGRATVAQLAHRIGVHPNAVRHWKQTVLTHGPELFAPVGARETRALRRRAAAHEHEKRTVMLRRVLGKGRWRA
jgi:transposase-like protein